MAWLIWLPALLLWGAAIFLMHRLSAFRVDRPWHDGYFGPVVESLSGFGWMRRENYTEAAQHLREGTLTVWLAALAASLLAGMVTLAIL